MIATHGHDDGHAREIAHGLATAVRAATAAARAAPADSELAWTAAADVAELVRLDGLAALLNACRVHAGAPPRDVANVLERLERLALACETSGDITPFVAADRELAALAGVLDAQEWAAPAPSEPARVAVQLLSVLLADLELDPPGLAESAQVTLPVAAGLRAALDWLGAEQSGPLRVSVQDAALTLSVRVAHEPGLAPAGAVLELTGGALLPEADGRWALRVPLHAERPAFLLARQGRLSLALAWPAVARLRITDAAGRASSSEPSLAPWSPLERPEGERPAALIAQGLKRAWLHLDHIVWRVFARPQVAHAPAEVPGGRLVVLGEEGESYWVVDALEALAGVPELHTPPARLRSRAVVEAALSAAEPGASRGRVSETAEPELATLAAHDVTPAASTAPPDAPHDVTPAALPAPAAAPSAPARLVVLGPQNVRPIVRPRPRAHQPGFTVVAPAPAPVVVAPAPPPAVVAPAQVVAPAPAPPEPTAVESQGPRPRRALVVDDSLVARIALARVLEREGWVVEGAERASEMWAALDAGDWTAVFVDVSLPDASGRAHLRQLVARQLIARQRFELIALTRDGFDAELVAGTGITRVLKKPFAPGVVEGLVRDLPGIAAGQ